MEPDGSLVRASRRGILPAELERTHGASPHVIALRNVTQLERFSGARTRAAWNASFTGIAIKISQDGPVQIYREDWLRAEIG